jgi:hypothetical protein
MRQHFAHTIYLCSIPCDSYIEFKKQHSPIGRSNGRIYCVLCEVQTASLCIKQVNERIQIISRSASQERRGGKGRRGEGFFHPGYRQSSNGFQACYDSRPQFTRSSNTAFSMQTVNQNLFRGSKSYNTSRRIKWQIYRRFGEVHNIAKKKT